jgi:hypothetical protein
MADKQGLKPGDVIYRYGGVAIASLEDLRRAAFQPGAREREIAARRGRQTVKTVVAAGPLGLGGVAVRRGELFWKRLPVAPYQPDFSSLEGDGEAWYRLTQDGKPYGFEWRRRRWVNGEMQLHVVTGLIAEEGEESVRVMLRLRTGDRLTCSQATLRATGPRSVEMDASCSSDRWVVMIDGKSLAPKAPGGALPSHAISVLAATLPFVAGRAYNVVRIDEYDFEPSYGCQLSCLGAEMGDAGNGGEPTWRFDLTEYGMHQMSFWLDAGRQLLRADYGGLLAARVTREDALDGLPDTLRALAASDPWRHRQWQPTPAEAPAAGAPSRSG